ncbi:MAG: hypothetical protein OXI80_06675 [Caldilineaceae bacterium]|nr:hypothetical protein [Caldilineaceae bacterium]
MNPAKLVSIVADLAQITPLLRQEIRGIDQVDNVLRSLPARSQVTAPAIPSLQQPNADQTNKQKEDDAAASGFRQVPALIRMGS